MDTMKITVGNTVDFLVDVEGLSANPTDAKIEIYSEKKFPEGLQGLVETFTPVNISGETIQFVFDTDQLAPAPKRLYGRFYVNDSSKKINAYFKMSFVY